MKTIEHLFDPSNENLKEQIEDNPDFFCEAAAVLSDSVWMKTHGKTNNEHIFIIKNCKWTK